MPKVPLNTNQSSILSFLLTAASHHCFMLGVYQLTAYLRTFLLAPCGLRGCKNGPAPFPGRMSYKATKPGLVSVLCLSMFLLCWCLLGPLFRLDALALSVIATATWLAGWVAVTLRYCINTAKPIGKLFRPSESPIILVF